MPASDVSMHRHEPSIAEKTKQFAVWIINRKWNTRLFIPPHSGFFGSFFCWTAWNIKLREMLKVERREAAAKICFRSEWTRSGIWSSNDMSLTVHCIVITRKSLLEGIQRNLSSLFDGGLPCASPLTVVCSWFERKSRFKRVQHSIEYKKAFVSSKCAICWLKKQRFYRLKLISTNCSLSTWK